MSRGGTYQSGIIVVVCIWFLFCLQFAVRNWEKQKKKWLYKRKCCYFQQVQNGRAWIGTTLSTSRLVHHTMSVLHWRVLMEVSRTQLHCSISNFPFIFRWNMYYHSEQQVSGDHSEKCERNHRNPTSCWPPTVTKQTTTNTDLILITLCKTATMNTCLLWAH